jgi:RNA polymerase sigma-70 factor (ECF subfamily)
MIKNNKQTEAELVRKVKSGDQKAFKELYNAYADSLYLFMKQFSFDTQLVEDWVQRAFIKSYLNIQKFDGISLYKTWLYKIAINEMKMDFRKSGSGAGLSFDEAEPLAEIEDIDFQWNMVMKNWLYELNEIKRMVFIMYEVEGYSHAEIAGMLNINESASRTILTRTKCWLKKKWMETEGKNE